MSHGLLGEGVQLVGRFRWIAARKAKVHNLFLARSTLRVTPSSYYEWQTHHGGGPSEADLDEANLVNKLRLFHDTLEDAYGSPRLTRELTLQGYWVNHKRTGRLAAYYGLYDRDARRRKQRTTIPDVSAPPLPDLIQRDFRVGEPGRRTCSDITYISTDEACFYLADVEDLGSRRVTSGFDGRPHGRRIRRKGDGSGDSRRQRQGHDLPSRQEQLIHVEGLSHAP